MLSPSDPFPDPALTASAPAAPGGSALFRARALEQLGSPDRVDLAVRIVRPASWLALLSFALVLCGGLSGAALIAVPEQMTAAGLLLPAAGAQPVFAAQTGLLEGFAVQDGDLVTKSQPLARVGGVPLLAPFDGEVVSLDMAPGRPVQAGAQLLTLLPTDGPVELVLFLRPVQARALRPGMAVQIAVESGTPVALQGHVGSIASRPSTIAAIARRLGNAVLAQTLAQAGSAIEVRVPLDAPAARLPAGGLPSGTLGGMSAGGLSGLLAQASITTGSRSLLQMIMPGLRSGAAE